MAKNFSVKKVGAIIIGDEILSGKREDKHFGKLISLLAVRHVYVVKQVDCHTRVAGFVVFIHLHEDGGVRKVVQLIL